MHGCSPRSWSLQYGAAVLAAIVMAITVPGIVKTAGRDQTGPPEEGQTAPPFALRNLRGEQHSWLDLRGRYVLLGFVCGCPPCRELVRAWSALPARYPHVAMLAITAMSPADAREFVVGAQKRWARPGLLPGPTRS